MFAGFDGEVDVVKRVFVGAGIAKRHMIEPDLAADVLEFYSALVFFGGRVKHGEDAL